MQVSDLSAVFCNFYLLIGKKDQGTGLRELFLPGALLYDFMDRRIQFLNIQEARHLFDFAGLDPG